MLGSEAFREGIKAGDIVRYAAIGAALMASVQVVLGVAGSVELGTLFKLAPAIALSYALTMLLYALKGVRFYILTRNLSDLRISFKHAALVRVASELFSLVSISFLGDELFRVYYLRRRGVDAGRSVLISYYEVFVEVVTAASIVLIGAAYLLLRGFEPGIMHVVVAASAATLTFHLLLILGAARLGELAKAAAGKALSGAPRNLLDRVTRLIDDYVIGFGSESRALLSNIRLTGSMIGLTYLAAAVTGSTLYVIACQLGIPMNLLEATLVTYMSLALSAIPVTVCGSGVMELTILVCSCEFAGYVPWALPIAYRISSYFLPLITTGVLLCIAVEMGMT
ncbi:hypothetical protein B6U99_02100 [Candidatus Geothermarchaeota archaeon ex4572_27]|nr:MAG: hypothetical protein B6U99_02100 [Candidatus Geothermarchaeota archaeon ex4572_27]